MFFSPKKNQATNHSEVNLEQKIIANLGTKKIPTIGQLKYLPKFLTTQEKIKLKISLVVFAIVFILLGCDIYFFHLSDKPAIGGEYREGIVGNFNKLDFSPDKPSTLGGLLSRLVYSSLLRYDSSLILQPDLAENYNLSKDKKSIDFCLKKNIIWHNKKNLTIDEVLKTYQTAISGKKEYSDLKIEKTTDNCLRVSSKNELQDRMSLFTLNVLPADNSPYIGSGPFAVEIKNLDFSHLSITLNRFPSFYGQKPYLKKIILNFYPSLDEAADALRFKKIDGLGYLSPGKINPEEFNNYKYLSLPLPNFTAIFFNLHDEALFNSLDMRKVITTLTPTTKILELIGEKEALTAGEKELYNPKVATSLLEKNGWKKDKDGVWLKNKKKLEVSLTVVKNPTTQAIASLILEEWKKFGLTTNLNVIDNQNLIPTIKDKKFQVILLGVFNLNFDPFYLWHSSQRDTGFNISGFTSRRADEILEKMQLTKDENEKKALEQEFEKILEEKVAMIPLYRSEYNYLINQNVKGTHIVQLNYPEDRFNGVNNWYLTTKKSF